VAELQLAQVVELLLLFRILRLLEVDARLAEHERGQLDPTAKLERRLQRRVVLRFLDQSELLLRSAPKDSHERRDILGRHRARLLHLCDDGGDWRICE
jgi:hypothetical protein